MLGQRQRRWVSINPHGAELFLYKPRDDFELIVNVLVSSFCFICYSSTTIINNVYGTLLLRDSTLDVRI